MTILVYNKYINQNVPIIKYRLEYDFYFNLKTN